MSSLSCSYPLVQGRQLACLSEGLYDPAGQGRGVAVPLGQKYPEKERTDQNQEDPPVVRIRR